MGWRVAVLQCLLQNGSRTLPTDRLRHAGHGDFLYLRGSVFYFRRSVPPALREAFGKGEVVTSLGTANLAEARHLLADHVRAFDIKAAKAGGRRDPTPPAPVAAIPDRDQMNAAVRAWLAETIQQSDPMATGRVPSDEDVSALSGQHRQSATHLQSSAVFGSPAGLATEWIAQAVAEREGWALGDQSPEYRYLFNVVHAGQLEVASQVPELIGLRPVTVRNAALFGRSCWRLTKPVHGPLLPFLTALSVISSTRASKPMRRPGSNTASASRCSLKPLVRHAR